MSQPVKLSDALVLDARIAAEVQERSIAGQVEFWARLGRSIEPLLNGQQAMILCRTVGAKSLFNLIDSVEKPAGRSRLRALLASEPFPHFESHPTKSGMLVCIDEDGNRTTGRFVNREFVAERANTRMASSPLRKNKKTMSVKAVPVASHPVHIQSKSSEKSKKDVAWA